MTEHQRSLFAGATNYTAVSLVDTLDGIYGDSRNQIADYFDLENLADRLRAMETSSPALEGLPDLHLKPNLFGLGLNVNRLLGRVRNWWRRL